jgi:hypothetical protein
MALMIRLVIALLDCAIRIIRSMPHQIQNADGMDDNENIIKYLSTVIDNAEYLMNAPDGI